MPGVLAVAVDGVVIVGSVAWLVAVAVVVIVVTGVLAVLVTVVTLVVTGVVTVLWVPVVGVVYGLCLAHVRSIPRKKRKLLGLNGCEGDAGHRLDIPLH